MKDRIRLVRKEAGLTQEAFAEKIGAKKFTVVSYESGKRTPLPVTIRAISREFDVSENWLMTGEGQMHEPKTRAQIASAIADRYMVEDTPTKNRMIELISETDEEFLKTMIAKLKDFINAIEE